MSSRGGIGPSTQLRGPTCVGPSPFAAIFRLIGYGLLGGGAFVAVVVLASLLQGDLAKVWADQIRRTREKPTDGSCTKVDMFR